MTTTRGPKKQIVSLQILLFTPLANSQQKDARATVAIFESQEEVCTINTGPQSLIYTALYRLLCQTMANREMQQANMQNSNSPQPVKRGTDSPALEHSPANKDSPAPPPQQSPAAEQAEGAGEGSEKAPVEMTLDITSFRKPGEKTFTQRSRLFIGNVPLDMPEEEFKNMFAKYGNVNEVFINRDRGFGFVRLV